MSECTCYPVPFEDCITYGSAVEPGSAFEPNPDCPEHFRRPPHRLADGSWSDGVDRTKPIRDNYFGEQNPQRMSVFYECGWNAMKGNWEYEEFPTYAEAIAYADRAARNLGK